MLRRREHQGPPDFDRVSATKAEVEAHVTKYGYRPHVYRVRCVNCGKRIWGSGMGIGSHRHACTYKQLPPRDERGLLCRHCGSRHVELDRYNPLRDEWELRCFDCGVREGFNEAVLFPELHKGGD